MWLCQEINEVHYTHHIFYASLWHVYCLHRNAALFKEKKENNSEAARIRCPLFQKQQFPGDLLFFGILVFHRLPRKNQTCFSKCRELLNEIKFTMLQKNPKPSYL